MYLHPFLQRRYIHIDFLICLRREYASVASLSIIPRDNFHTALPEGAESVYKLRSPWPILVPKLCRLYVLN